MARYYHYRTRRRPSEVFAAFVGMGIALLLILAIYFVYAA